MTIAFCGVPPWVVMLKGASGLLVSAKLAGVSAPRLPVLVKVPATVFALIATWAMPLLLVVAVVVVKPPNKPDAPVVGVLKVT